MKQSLQPLPDGRGSEGNDTLPAVSRSKVNSTVGFSVDTMTEPRPLGSGPETMATSFMTDPTL